MSERPVDILLVEDNPGDVRLTREAFAEAQIRNDLRVVTRGTEALDYLRGRGDHEGVPRPDIVLLDLNLPGMDGIEVLEEIKADSELRIIPVIVLTSSRAEEDVMKSYTKHANAYLTKPVDGGEFVEMARSIGDFWIRMVALPAGAE